MSDNTLDNYKSAVNIDMFSNKLYVDPQYGSYQPQALVNYSVLKGKWEIEDLPEDNSIKLILQNTGDSVTLSFNTLKDKIEFVKGIYSEFTVKQVGRGMDLEKFANNNIMPKMINYLDIFIKKIKPVLKLSECTN